MPKVLIVEDEVLVSRMYQKMVESEGFEVQIASNGVDGIQMAKDWKPDLIMMDVMMPEMNGVQALQTLKEDPEISHIPVIMLTNMSGEHDAELALSKGASQFWVKKDLDPKTLKENLLEVLDTNTKK